jgi:hypothetical protein
VGDIDTEAVDSLKTLDPNRPIREADMDQSALNVRFVPPIADIIANLVTGPAQISLVSMAWQSDPEHRSARFA